MKKPERILDILICIVAIPAMLLFFPAEQWLGVAPESVVVFVLWLYAVYFINRYLTSRLLYREAKLVTTAFAIMALMTVITVMMSLKEAEVLNEETFETVILEASEPVWALYIFVFTVSLAVGILARKIQLLREDLEAKPAPAPEPVVVERVVPAPPAEDRRYITVTSAHKKVRIPLKDLRYAQSNDNYVTIFRDGGDPVVSQMTLTSLMEMLPDRVMVRIHRTYAVAVDRIGSKTATSVSLSGEDTVLPVGRAYKMNLTLV